VLFSQVAASPLALAAPEPPRFGAQEQLVVSSDAGLSVERTSALRGDRYSQDQSTTYILLRPAVDYFVLQNLSVGIFVGLRRSSQEAVTVSTIELGSRVGYAIAMSERFSLWPKIGLSYSRTDVDVHAPQDVTVLGPFGTSAVTLNVFAPVLYHPVPHFFLGFGPGIDIDKSAITVGARLTLGGWM
jgi:hypothetical protein